MKVSELAGAQLNYWVGKALGLTDEYLVNGQRAHRVPMFISCPSEDSEFGDMFEPSTRWDHGGPIIDRDRIATEPGAEDTGNWLADMVHPARTDGVQRTFTTGPTPLIAAMRAKVASVYGNEVN